VELVDMNSLGLFDITILSVQVGSTLTSTLILTLAKKAGFIFAILQFVRQ